MKQRTWLILFSICWAFTGCQTDLDINAVIDENAPFTLTTRSVDPQTGLSASKTEIIEVNTEKWMKLVDFAQNNMTGWQSTPASYLGDVYVTQGDLRLTHTKGSNGVVITFTDKESNPKQFTKGIDKSELDFLTE